MQSVATLLDKYPGAVKELARKAQELILNTLQDITETVDAPAKMIAYGYGPKYADSIYTIILSQKGIKIGFYKGASLPDPERLLTGTGKVHKYVDVKNPEDIENAAVKKLLKEAYKAYQQRK